RVQLGALAGLEAFESTARVNVARGALMLPTVWIGAWYSGLYGALVGLALVSLLAFAIGHRILRRWCDSLSIQIVYSGGLEPGILTTSASLWVSAVLMAGSSWAVAVLLARNPSGLAELGLYNAADKWKTALLFLPNMLFQVTLPMLSHSHAAKHFRDCRRIVLTSLGSTAALTGAGAVVVFWFSPLFMISYG